jgi:hypothetical protein
VIATLAVLALGWLAGTQQLKADLAAARDSLAKCATVHHSRPLRTMRPPLRTSAPTGDVPRSAIRGSAVGSVLTDGASSRNGGRVHSPEKVAGIAESGGAPITPPRRPAPSPSGFLSGPNETLSHWYPVQSGASRPGVGERKNGPGFYSRHPGWSTLGALALGAAIGTAICQTNHEHGVRIATAPSPPDDDDHEHHHGRKCR